ncbi:hypothetical protein OPKNFCMD_1960 [Methylobacterium crusticola]|uniref:Protein kinase domain-containing protein n=1 Tax=Methylobacterium crusticola TaxID=1697972 RepID=A0ABQ4QV56_9HYPH|nr:leucine-rich repeat-containing protein kinase family protein [Methylobacterium crusticola]GJD49230.1 hypothetical protein OPKNFCMD_1960 [Methylobacterium crusticola]
MTIQAPMSDVLHALRRGDLAGARELRLTGGLAEFPREILGLADTLELLDLSGGTLSDLPDELGRLRKLRVLFCSGNRFARLPPVLGECRSLSQIGFRGTGLREVPGEALPPALRWLTLTDNRIERLPDRLGERPLLQKLMLSGNRLTALPATLAGARRLELVRLAANRMEALPEWLLALPGLAWVSWAGNPLEPGAVPPDVPLVPWSRLALGARLGEGASGQVHRARWRQGPGPGRTVALKLFKGAMTSDGLPEREMAACLAAGEHPNLTGGLGRLAGHPDGAQGLVMPLLPDGWRPLAGPPSLSSCSRDVYDPGLRLAPACAVRIATAVAAAAGHLHARGLGHGDLYGHNVVWDGAAGEARLSDFGAASGLPAGRAGDALRRIEVRAWGLLLGELLALCAPEPAAADALRRLERACVQPDVSARPTMDAVRDALDAARPPGP